MTDWDLLQQYVQTKSQPAFEELVRRHMGWIQSAAVRHVHDEHLAEDITQAVFLGLLQQAKRLHSGVAVPTWLFQVTRYSCTKALRARHRRQFHEQKAAAMKSESSETLSESEWRQLSPMLDELVSRLSKQDQEAILLRFYEQKSFAEVAEELGISEEAGKKRVQRAVDKLRQLIGKRGLACSAGALSGGLMVNVTEVAPAALAAKTMAVLTAAAQGATIPAEVAAIAEGAMHMIAMARIKIAAVLALALVAALGLSIWTEHLIWGQATKAGAAFPRPATSPASMPAILSKNDLLLAAEKARARIADLTVSFTFNATKEDISTLAYRSHAKIVIKGPKSYIDHEFGGDPRRDPRMWKRIVAYNGQRSTIYESSRGVATVMAGQQAETRTQGRGFFDMMLLNAPMPFGQGYADQNLISLLRAEACQCRPHLEVVDGRRCYVLDVQRLGGLAMTVWLDAERGFLPVRQVYYDGRTPPQVQMEFTVEQAVQVQDGLWFAVRGRKKVAGSEYVMTVDGMGEGKPALSLNAGVEDGFFDLWQNLPAGTPLFDTTTGTAGPDHRSTPEPAGQGPTEVKHSISPSMGTQPATTTQARQR